MHVPEFKLKEQICEIGRRLYAKGFAAAWEAKGGKIQGPVVFDPAQATFDSEAGQIVANNPDAYVIIDYPDTYAKMGASLVRTGALPEALSRRGLDEAALARQRLEGLPSLGTH